MKAYMETFILEEEDGTTAISQGRTQEEAPGSETGTIEFYLKCQQKTNLRFVKQSEPIDRETQLMGGCLKKLRIFN